MQNPPEVEFNRFIFQNLLKYVPEPYMPREGRTETMTSTLSSGKFWPIYKPGLVSRLWPMVVVIGLLEVIVGLVLLLCVGFYTCAYDALYNTEESKLMSNAAFFGCVMLIFCGLVLLFALLLERQRPIRFYIFVSVFLCIYIFGLACMKIHFALLVVEKDTYKIISEARTFDIFLSTACVIGIVTMMGSVVQFIGTVAVFTYYHLKYLQPVS